MTIEELFKIAQEEHRAGQYLHAAHKYRLILAAAPEAANVHRHLGLIQRELGDLNGATACYLKAIDLNPLLVETYFDLGNIYFHKNALPDAITCFMRAVELAPDNYKFRNNLDSCLTALGDNGVSVKCYQDLLQKNPLDTESLFFLAIKYAEDGRVAEAKQLRKRIVENNLCFGEKRLKRVRIETSSACNLRCRHCATGLNYGVGKRSVMDMDIFDKIINQLKEIPSVTECVMYLGGEPLLNKNLALMCRRIKSETNVIHTQFNSNGMLLTEEICRDLAGSGLNLISISIDGRSPEENDSIRKGADYRKVAANVRMLRRYLEGSDTSLWIANTIFKRDDDPDIPEIPNFLKKDLPGLHVDCNYAVKWPDLDGKTAGLDELSICNGVPRQFCDMPFNQLAIRPNGDVVLCCYDLLGREVMGNIHQEKLSHIWTNSAYHKLRLNMLNHKVEELPVICKKCPKYCGEQLIASGVSAP